MLPHCLTDTKATGTLPNMLGIGFPGIAELLVILVIVVVIFGARRLPEIGSGLGKSIKNFRSGLSGKDEIDVTPKEDEMSDGKKP